MFHFILVVSYFKDQNPQLSVTSNPFQSKHYTFLKAMFSVINLKQYRQDGLLQNKSTIHDFYSIMTYMKVRIHTRLVSEHSSPNTAHPSLRAQPTKHYTPQAQETVHVHSMLLLSSLITSLALCLLKP